MAGAVVITRRDGSKIDLANVQSGILVPRLEEVLSVDLSRVRWVLVIEKEVRRLPITHDRRRTDTIEAAYQSIVLSEDWQEMMWHAVVVTVSSQLVAIKYLV